MTDDLPGTEPEKETVNRESHPSSGGSEGLSGDLGISSEREGPYEGVESTGTLASTADSTDGETPTDRGKHGYREDPEDPDKPDETLRVSNVDRTVGETQPDPVANKHEFDPEKNPRH